LAKRSGCLSVGRRESTVGRLALCGVQKLSERVERCGGPNSRNLGDADTLLP
jgi:hypothetical protein